MIPSERPSISLNFGAVIAWAGCVCVHTADNGAVAEGSRENLDKLVRFLRMMGFTAWFTWRQPKKLLGKQVTFLYRREEER